MEATRVPIPDVESATPNLDIVRRRAATGQAGPLRRYQAVMATDAPVSELEERATQELSAFELNPERQQYLDQYKKDAAGENQKSSCQQTTSVEYRC